MTISLNTLIPSAAIDYVAVFTQDFQQIFSQARAIKAVVKEQSKVMEHPVESGAIITDHRIVLPVEIELSLILQAPEYADVYKVIRQYYLNGTLLVVQTRSGIYENQLISQMPHEEDPTLYNALTIALSLKQVQIVSARFGIVPKNPKNSTTVDRGTQQGSIPTAPKVSAAKQKFDALRGRL